MSSFTKQYYESENYRDYMFREPRYHKLASEICVLLRQLKLLNTESKMLDYGCGLGFLMSGLIAQNFTHVSGMDISEYAIDFAKKKGLHVVDSLNEPYDVVFALDVLEHMDDVQLYQLFSSLHTDTLVCRIPVSSDGVDFHLEISRNDPTHINCKTKGQWETLLRSFGFNVIIPIDLYSIYDSDGVFSFIALKR